MSAARPTAATISWLFDFISPYAYLGFHSLERLPPTAPRVLQPVLFAGILKHWGHKGPAEVAPKRLWTYRSCIWLAQRMGLPFRMPASHPFNSLPYLRLAIAAGNTVQAVEAIFTALWTTGAEPSDPEVVAALARALGIPLERLGDPDVKAQLRGNTERAVQAGVFGVPSFVIDGQVFWGSDSQDFAAAYLGEPRLLDDPEIRRADSLPVGAVRT